MCSYSSGPSPCYTQTFWAGKCCKSHEAFYGLERAAGLLLLFQLVLSLWCLPRIFEHKRVVSPICCNNRQLKDRNKCNILKITLGKTNSLSSAFWQPALYLFFCSQNQTVTSLSRRKPEACIGVVL